MLLTAAEGPTAHAVFAFVTAAQALFGFGCGGEFPVAAASAAERAESTDELKGLRGQTTVLVFSMQVSSNDMSCSQLALISLHLSFQGSLPAKIPPAASGLKASHNDTETSAVM